MQKKKKRYKRKSLNCFKKSTNQTVHIWACKYKSNGTALYAKIKIQEYEASDDIGNMKVRKKQNKASI